MSPYIRMVAFLSLGLLAVFGWHFATVFGYLGSAPENRMEFFTRLGVIMAGFFVASVVSAILTAKIDGKPAFPDEREEKIELKTERLGLFVLYIGLLVVVWFSFLPMTPIQIANGILAAVCASEFIKIIYALFIMNRQV